MTNPYAPPSAHTEPVVDRYPNEDISGDRGKVVGAGVTLIIIGVLQLLVAAAIASGKLRLPMANFLAIATLIEGGLTVTLGLFTLKNSYGAAVTGLVLSSIGLLMSLLSLNIIGIAIRAGVVALVARGVNAIKGINNRIGLEEQGSPLTAYYHFFVPLLVRVMAADGHLDRRERKKIAEVCDSMHISRYEQHRLIGEASREGTGFDVGPRVARYLSLAKQIGLPNPEQQLIHAAIAVAGADGVFVEAEEKILLRIGAAVGLEAEDVEWRIATHKAKLADLDVERARELLNVGAQATPEEIEASYANLKGELQPQAYGHLGQKLSGVVAGRGEVLDKAREIVLGAFPK